MTNVESMTNARMINRPESLVSYLPSAATENRDWREEGLLRENGDPLEYDLEERTARFGEAVIRFAKKIPRGPDNDRLIGQLVGAATSVGANYCEADDAVSKKDFRCKIGTCKKEAREAKFFLRMVAAAEESLKGEARILWQEAKELHLIFCAIWRK